MPTDLFATRFVDCWIVFGRTGEYSDRREWPIAVFMLEETAKELVKQLDAKALELNLSLKSYDDTDRAKLKAFNDFFGFTVVEAIDYTGVSFWYGKAIYGG